MHAKAHNWTCQVIWGGRWQTDSACSTGEEVEQINSYMSRCSNTTKYMLPEGRDELLTEHAMGWNKRKILNLVDSLSRRYLRAQKMLLAAKENVCDVMATNGILSDQLDYEKWRSTVLEHAKDRSKQRARLRKRMTSDKAKLKTHLDLYNNLHPDQPKATL